MLKKIESLWNNKQQRNELILYIVMGLLTTLVNYGVYFLCTRAFGLGEILTNVIAWIISVVFAFFTNRKYVFKSQKSGGAIAEELATFTAGRVGSYVLFDLALFFLLYSVFHMNDLIAKLITNVGVIVFNYIVGKFFVFKKDKKQQ